MTFSMDVLGALRTVLLTVSGTTPIAYLNRDYTPVSGTMFLAEALYTADGAPYQLGPGSAGKYRHEGMYQVTVVAPRNAGFSTAMALADAISGAFRVATPAVGTGLSVLRVNIAPPFSDDPWWRVPVTVDFTVDDT
jgi:hypothetical protein